MHHHHRWWIVAAAVVLVGIVGTEIVRRVQAVSSAFQTVKDIKLRQELATMLTIPGETPPPEIAGIAAMWPLPTDGTHTLEVQVGSCDSLELLAGGYGPPVELTLVDPSGKTVPPDPRDSIEIDERSGMGAFATVKRWIRSPTPGAWTVTMTGQAQGMFWAYEHGGAIVLVNEPPALGLGETQRIEVFTHDDGEPIRGLEVSATIVNPIGQKSRHVMVDDGTNGDETAGDGVYTATIPGHEIEGTYLVEAWAQGRTGGRTVNRRTVGTYQVDTMPDLAIVPGGVTIHPTREVGVFRAEVTFTNIGNGPAKDVNVVFRDRNTGLGIGRPVVSLVAPGDTATVGVTWKPASYRSDSIRVSVGLRSDLDYVHANDGAVTSLALINGNQR